MVRFGCIGFRVGGVVWVRCSFRVCCVVGGCAVGGDGYQAYDGELG